MTLYLFISLKISKYGTLLKWGKVLNKTNGELSVTVWIPNTIPEENTERFKGLKPRISELWMNPRKKNVKIETKISDNTCLQGQYSFSRAISDCVQKTRLQISLKRSWLRYPLLFNVRINYFFPADGRKQYEQWYVQSFLKITNWN